MSLHAITLSASLTVKDLDRSVAWYHDVMGFEIEHRYERDGIVRAVALKAGAVSFVVGQDDGAKGWDRIKGQGLSLMLTTEQDVDQLAAEITKRGGRLESEPADMPWGARIFRLEDPDGYKLTISSTY